MCPFTHCFHSGPHLQADEKRQLHSFPAFQFVPRPADSQKESRCHCLFGQISIVFYSMALEIKKERYIGKAFQFLLSNGTCQFMENVRFWLLLIRQTFLQMFFSAWNRAGPTHLPGEVHTQCGECPVASEELTLEWKWPYPLCTGCERIAAAPKFKLLLNSKLKYKHHVWKKSDVQNFSYVLLSNGPCSPWWL